MPSKSKNVAIIAVAGARKTQTVIDGALDQREKRTLITTYTNENLRQIAARIQAREGVVPFHLTLRGWFSFLLGEAIRPYQSFSLGKASLVRGLNFEGARHRYISREKNRHAYYLDRHHDVYRGGVSDLACFTNSLSTGLVISRLEEVFDRIYIDEIQDMVGYDLDFLDLLFKSRIEITVVGDPRQYTLATNEGARNKKYRGVGLTDWLDERVDYCHRENRNVSSRCSQGICDFASALFPGLPALTAEAQQPTGHDGIHTIAPNQVHEYVAAYQPVILRHSKLAETLGHPAMNIGVAKGSTFDRVLIFTTKPMREYLIIQDLAKLKNPESLYVAVTRARHSATFVV